ncbi:NAD(P)-binding protein [Xylariaceae sp. FL1019]|nr:NAD(P)-binding protein [Xylariaceae sp. FL1019]
MFGKYAQFTDPVHNNSYPAISPKRPELSQAGKTVLITGGGSGIGYGIARGFVRASAAKVIILGRRADVISKAAETLIQEGEKTEVIGIPCDIADKSGVDALWQKLKEEGTVIDVLALNAVAFAPVKPLLECGVEELWKVYDVNVRAQLQMTDLFYKQEGQGASETKYLIYVSSVSVHDYNVGKEQLGYALTKNSFQLALQLITMDTLPEKMQVISYHPGAIFTESARDKGWTEDTIPWDHVDLPGHFAVWAASPEAKFLHGRFVWASWDIEKLQNGEIRKLIDEDPTYLQIGINGVKA